jgi:hypothetical protein
MRRRRQAQGMNLDFLMDTLTNVVGILILILVLNSLNIKKAVERIRELDPAQFGVSTEQLDEIQEQVAEQQAVLRELGPRAFGAEAELVRDRTELQQQQQRVQQLQRELAEAPVETLPPDPRIASLQEQQTQLERELQEAATELDELRRQVDAEPAVAPPSAKIVRLPNPRAAPPDAQPVLFFCRDGAVSHFDPELLQERVQKRVQFLLRPLQATAGPDGEIDCQKLVETYNKDPISDRDYRVLLAVENFNLVLVFEPRGAGEPAERLASPTSRYQQALRRMHPERHYARFLVWNDSFDVYVAARHQCDERGVPAGWEPQTQDFQWKTPLGIRVVCQGKPKPKPPTQPPAPRPERPPGPPPPPLPNDIID